MYVRIETPGSLDVENFEFEDNGLTSVPFFYNTGKEGTVAVIRVMDKDGKVIQAAKLVVSGVDGKLTLQNRSMPGKPICERPPEPLESPVPPKK